MSDVIHSYTLERDGLTFRVDHCADTDNGAPWENEDGHGTVSDWTTRDKSPGELVLNTDHGSKRFYDFADACRIALRDGWGARGAEEGMSKRQIAALAAREDYEHLRAWCNDEWSYIGVVVTLLDIEGNETDATDSLWGVDDNGDYAATVASDCVDNVMHGISAMLYGGDGAVYMSGSRSWRVKE
ncbi:hypothetical protein Sano_08 [Xylella phage Sano]|uniref:Uncharacterized protein n=1 Tax=Xylella phage Sano TaxID=1415148 RepID=V5Q7G8_9CAUD|nr:hypothetical protein FGG50_gp08 [Xylella phage Sano]AHB12028.1 hypothetical protein Sano_08 [Xylella phage Sano]